jgi:hypothetical protein
MPKCSSSIGLAVGVGSGSSSIEPPLVRPEGERMSQLLISLHWRDRT